MTVITWEELVLDSSRPIFEQIAEEIETSIINGSLAEETRAPSTNELAEFYRINPATAGKGVNLLVDQGILYKQRGMGMYVAKGAREQLLNNRRSRFAADYLQPLLAEAARLGITPAQVSELLQEISENQPNH
jgi:DNA-binding transcriptional regulator YhcF (GntR family)